MRANPDGTDSGEEWSLRHSVSAGEPSTGPRAGVRGGRALQSLADCKGKRAAQRARSSALAQRAGLSSANSFVTACAGWRSKLAAFLRPRPFL